jgi:hypothetical protein
VRSSRGVRLRTLRRIRKQAKLRRRAVACDLWRLCRDGAQSATVRRVEGADAVGAGDDGEILVDDASVSTGSGAEVTETGQYRFLAGWRSDPFFFDAEGVLNDFQFTA